MSTALEATTMPSDWSRIMITSVHPSVDGGRWPIKRAKGESVHVRAGVIIDSHDVLTVELQHQPPQTTAWTTVRMTPEGNDEFTASFGTHQLGRHAYRVRAWLNRFATWQDQFARRVDGGESEAELASELKAGLDLVARALEASAGQDREMLARYHEQMQDGLYDAALSEELAALVRRYAPHDQETVSDTFEVLVDPVIARSGAWYEFFPRSAGDTPGAHATLDEAAKRLPRIKELGFDIVYLPPVHPIGETNRKGKDNAPTAGPDDPGSPWAIGGPTADGTSGGHKSVHPALGGIEAFDRFVSEAESLGLKVAIDIAFQTSPDHPYVEEHPAWFYHRPDGSIRYAENPPKKYQDVYPINFETDDWPALWQELKSVFEFWIEHGVTIFRVDNPHTKSFAFWEWCLQELRKDTPELIVLSEAFTQPKTMYGLAKLGFNNSYTYFTWRNTKHELEDYARELFHTEVAEFFRPNFWPNTPDILHDYLVHGGRAAHKVRFVLAATLSSAYGVYGPPYEHVFNVQHPDREEYAQNEKYEIRTWNWNDPSSLQPFMQKVNAARAQNPALRQMRTIQFHDTQNLNLLAYTKETADNLVLVVANLDPHHVQEGQVVLPLHELGLPHDQPYDLTDVLHDAHYTWQGAANYVRLDPGHTPVHLFRIARHGHHETQHPVYHRPVHA
ncbi:alpha-1,4-glucan--maltose-1-phosphate maltosyltransferase [Salisaeta longa]|uniref:alpha-1,4-glucan--maltose-1-phosphate maltosyltransferase n=1 Tax=Salisaeta longa TaxID=503170 RepID=UPI001E4424C3|nr:alpha-1,4-glucan--maltose-1-phosphate maltosyltransferase [Salisaeta longa]